MTRLCNLAKHYRSDKFGFHSYTPYYHQLLQNRDVHRVLEIGIGTPRVMDHVPNYQPGASLRMWREYFGGIADIFGLDIDPAAMIHGERFIHTFTCDQGNRGDLEATARALENTFGRFDLIVDDGSHLTEHQALTAEIFIPKLLSPTGLYIIEDVCFPKELYPLVPWPCEVKMFNPAQLADDCIFIIEGKNL